MSVPALTLTAVESRPLVRRWATCVQRGRLSHSYPDGRRLREGLESLANPARDSLYGDFELDQRTLLPTYREWTRLAADAAAAPGQLDALGPRARLARNAERRGSDVDLRMLAKWDYYEGLRTRTTPGLDEISIKLRRHEVGAKRLHVTVVFDKHDASGLFVRFTIQMAQTTGAFGSTLVELDEREHAEHTDALRGLIYRYASTNAEMTFIKLNELDDVQVDSVQRGTVGPAFSPANSGAALPGIYEIARGGGWVAAFGLETADRTLSGESDNDPLRGAGDSKSLQGARRSLGYGVRHDRKFVVTAEHVDALDAFAHSRDCQNVIYPL